MMQPNAQRQGFIIKTDLRIPEPTVFDRDALTQIVVNLLDNSLKYANEAEDKTILVRTRPTEGYRSIEVEDHGPGIPPKLTKKIFDEFYRVEAESIRPAPGTGLGLALVKRFAQAHQGYVHIHPAQPTGSIFQVAISQHLTLTGG